MKKKVHQNRFLLIILVLIFVALPIVIQAAEPEATATTESWWQTFTKPFSSFTDTLKALGTLVLNVGTIIVLLTTGILPVIGIAAGITYGAMAVLSLIAAGLFESARGIILSTLDIPVIPGTGAVSVVQEGWRFSRDIVSLFFVVILTFIGLATILRLENFQFKKTLPALIIMAVLLNFSGLVVGFVVDMGNLATAVFIQPIRGTDILTGPLEAAAIDLLETVKQIPIGLMGDDPFSFITTTLFAPILNAGAKAIFYGALILMFLLIPLLFILRIGILWILTILAPFAFAAYILPQTRNLWSQWWKQLLQWSLMGIPMGFFLLLAMKVASIPIDLSAVSGTWFGDILVDIIQPLFILLFLVVGFSLSITLVPSAVNSFVNKTAPQWKEKAGAASLNAIRGIPAINRRETAIRRGLENTRFGGLVGGPGALATSLDKDRKTAGKKLETMGERDLRAAMAAPGFGRDLQLRRARGFELLAEKNWVTADDVTRYSADAFRFGVHGGAVYDKLPNLDPDRQRRVESMDVETFRKNIISRAFETPPPLGAAPGTTPTYTNEQLDTFYAMDRAKVDDMGTRGKRNVKAALYNLVTQRRGDIINEAIRLQRPGATADERNRGDKILDMAAEIELNPNYRR